MVVMCGVVLSVAVPRLLRRRLAMGCYAVAAGAYAAAQAPLPQCQVAPKYSDSAQAGGHVDGVRFAGAMLRKRLQSEGRGQREADALAALAASPRWQKFVPAFEGLEVDEDGEPWVVMENLVDGLGKPAVLDLKIGLRHWSDGAPAIKIAKETRKAATTTIGTHGMRVVGCRFPRPHDDGGPSEEVWGYKLGNNCVAAELPAVLHRFLGRLCTA
jgi:hypothetical protein